MFTHPGSRADRSYLSQTKPISQTYTGFLSNTYTLTTGFTTLPGCSITLPPGNWDIWGIMNGIGSGQGTVTFQLLNVTDNVVQIGSSSAIIGSGYAWTIPFRWFTTLTGIKNFVIQGVRDTGSTVQPFSTGSVPSTYLTATRLY